MSAPYLNELEEAFLSGCRDLHQVAERVGIDFETVCSTFNNGLLKGWWKVVVTTPKESWPEEYQRDLADPKKRGFR